MAIYNEAVTYKSSSDEIKHDDEIFSLDIPRFCYGDNGMDYGLFGLTQVMPYISGSIPSTWIFNNPTWYANKDGVNGIRSNRTAASSNGPGQVAGVDWMVPTVAQHYIGHYDEDLGGLNKKTTNQRLYHVNRINIGDFINYKLDDITHLFWK